MSSLSKSHRMTCVATVSFLAIMVASAPRQLSAFAYVFATEAIPGRVTHQFHYTGGAAENLTVTVGIDPTSINAAAMVTPTQNVIAVWNALVPQTGNLLSGAANNVPAGQFDFESTLLHEMGHALGLSHPNLGVVAGIVDPNTDYTQSFDGANNTFNLDDGADNVIGSRDDIRGDDVNANWFRKSNNNPFTLANVVDSTTYSRNLADLPAGSTFSANGSRAVTATVVGIPANTEAVLQQGQPADEAQRNLGHDDVAGILYSLTGTDELSGTADDYTLTLTYAGLTTAADVVIDFDNTQTTFAVTNLMGSLLTATHAVVTDADIFFSSAGLTWFFNDVPLSVPEPGSLLLAAVGLLGATGYGWRQRKNPDASVVKDFSSETAPGV